MAVEYPSAVREVLAYVETQYGAQGDHPFSGDAETAVLRHANSGKWFAIIMRVRRGQLGLDNPEASVWIMNLKPDPVLQGILRGQPGFLPAYHMNKAHWLTVILNEDMDVPLVRELLAQSYEQTGSKKKQAGGEKARITEWIVPSNPKYFDIRAAFAETDELLWKQGAGIRKGDTVYMYVCAPISAILYRCRVVQTDIALTVDEGSLRIRKAMRIRLLDRYEDGRVDRTRLAEHGVTCVRGPRGIPNSLKEEIRAMYGGENGGNEQ